MTYSRYSTEFLQICAVRSFQQGSKQTVCSTMKRARDSVCCCPQQMSHVCDASSSCCVGFLLTQTHIIIIIIIIIIIYCNWAFTRWPLQCCCGTGNIPASYSTGRVFTYRPRNRLKLFHGTSQCLQALPISVSARLLPRLILFNSLFSPLIIRRCVI